VFGRCRVFAELSNCTQSRVLRLFANRARDGRPVTFSDVGRELGISEQAAISTLVGVKTSRAACIRVGGATALGVAQVIGLGLALPRLSWRSNVIGSGGA
jgi:hypothetical protein